MKTQIVTISTLSTSLGYIINRFYFFIREHLYVLLVDKNYVMTPCDRATNHSVLLSGQNIEGCYLI